MSPGLLMDGGSFSDNGPGLGNVDSPSALPLPQGRSRHFPSRFPPCKDRLRFSALCYRLAAAEEGVLEKGVKISPKNAGSQKSVVILCSPQSIPETCGQKLLFAPSKTQLHPGQRNVLQELMEGVGNSYSHFRAWNQMQTL